MNELPPLPPGFTLDPPAPPAMPPLPPGFVLDGAPAAPQPAGGTDMPPMARAPGSMGQPEEPSFLARQGRNLMLGTQAVGRGLAETAATLPNLAGAALNIPLVAADVVASKAFDSRVPFRFNQDYGASIADAATSALNAVGVPTFEPENKQERLTRNVAIYGTQGLLGGMGLAKAAQASGAAAKPVIGDYFVRPYVLGDPTKVIAKDVLAGAGAGAGLSVAQEAPDSVRNAGGGVVGPLLDYLGMTMGGVGAVKTADMVRGTPPALWNGFRNSMTDDRIPLDPATGIPFTRGQVSEAARRYQAKAVDPAKAAGTIGENMQYYDERRLPMPTSGLMSGDAGLIGVENAARTRLGTNSLTDGAAAPDVNARFNFVERDNALRNAAMKEVSDLSPAGSNPEAFTGGVKEVLDDRLAQRTGQVDTAQGVVGAKEKDALAAVKDQEAQAAAFKARQAGVDDASRTIDKVYRDARSGIIEQNAKNYDPKRIDPGGETSIDTSPLSKAATTMQQRVSTLPDEIRKELVPDKLLSDLRKLSPILEEKTTTSPLVDAFGDPIRRTEQVNVGGPGKVSYEDINSVRMGIAVAQRKAQLAGDYSISDSLKTLKDEIDRSVEKMAGSGSPAGLRTQEALDYTKETVVPNLRKGVGGELDQIIKRDDTGTALPPGETAGRFLTSKESAEDLLRIARTANSEATAVSAAERWLFGKMAETGIADNGRLNPDGLVEWRDTGGNAKLLDTVPGLRQKFDELLVQSRNKGALSEATAAALRKAQADLKAAEGKVGAQERFNRSSTPGKVANSAPEQAVSTVFSQPDPAKAMREVVGTIGFNTAAKDGLKNAVSKHLITEIKTATTTIKADPGSTFDKHRRALAEVFDPEEMNNLQRASKLVEPLAKRYTGATVGSQTAERAMNEAWLPAEVITKLYFGMLKGGGIISNAKKTAGALFQGQDKAVQRIVDLANFDPQSAQHLLTMKASKPDSPAYNSALAKLIKRNELLIGLSQDDEEPAK